MDNETEKQIAQILAELREIDDSIIKGLMIIHEKLDLLIRK